MSHDSVNTSSLTFVLSHGGTEAVGNIEERIMFMSHDNYFSENEILNEYLVLMSESTY